MNKRSIERRLKKKFYDFTESIQDQKVRSLVEKDSIITGGCIASMLLGEKVNDYDIYFGSEKTALAVRAYYEELSKADLDLELDDDLDFITFEGVGTIATSIADDPDSGPYRPLFLSDNAITLSDGIQLITRFWGNAKAIHKNFDFAHVMNYWKSSNGKLYLSKRALESLLSKNLRYEGSLYPVCSLMRIRKFIERGWTINAGQMLKIIFQAHSLNLNNPVVLREQLIGVDVLYFKELIDRLSKEGNDEKITETFLEKIIDEVFE